MIEVTTVMFHKPADRVAHAQPRSVGGTTAVGALSGKSPEDGQGAAIGAASGAAVGGADSGTTRANT